MNISIKVNQTSIVLLALLVFVLLPACSSLAPAMNRPEEQARPPDRVDVVYFHLGEACRCMDPTGECIYATIWLNFQDELASGRLTFQRLKLDDEDNATLAVKYNATPFSLFINVVRGDTEHIIAVPEIWPIRYENEALAELVKSNIRQSLEE